MPPSTQGSGISRQRYRDSVAIEAEQHWQIAPLTTGFVAVEITFCVDTTQRNLPDVDNIIKTILDSLADIIYDDDRRVSDIICRRRYLGFRLGTSDASPTLLREFTQKRVDPFVHIQVTESLI